MRSFVEGSDFDSRLSGRTLTIVVNVLLIPTGSGEVKRAGTTVAWPAAEWSAWPAKFKQVVHDAWHNRFLLQCNFDYPGGRERVQHLECHLELNVSGLDDAYAEPAHLRAEVDYFGDRRFAGSSAFLRGNSRGAEETDVFLDYGDVFSTEKAGGNFQHGAIHEFGHYLGLHHRCHGIGSGYCSGVSGVNDADIMASGDTHRPWHAEPWLRRLPAHDFHADLNWWSVVIGDDERSEVVQPSDDSLLGLQTAMKPTAGLLPADIEALLAPAGASQEAGAALRNSVNTGLGLPLSP